MGMTITKAQLCLIPTGKKVLWNGDKFTVKAKSPHNSSRPNPKQPIKYLENKNRIINLDQYTVVDVLLPPQDCCMGAAFL